MLVLNILQKAREEKFPQHLCFTLKRLVCTALSNEIYYSKKSQSYEYQRFQLLLCASEISLQGGDYLGCISHAQNALRLSVRDSILFFAHLQLCRAHVSQEDLSSMKDEYMKCLQLKSDYPIAWISLKLIESRYKQHIHLNAIDSHFEACLKESGSSWNTWTAIFDLVRGQSFIWEEDFVLAEKALAHGISMGTADSCLYLCHGINHCCGLFYYFVMDYFLCSYLYAYLVLKIIFNNNHLLKIRRYFVYWRYFLVVCFVCSLKQFKVELFIGNVLF